jgi:hypothetical protein
VKPSAEMGDGAEAIGKCTGEMDTDGMLAHLVLVEESTECFLATIKASLGRGFGVFPGGGGLLT